MNGYDQNMLFVGRFFVISYAMGMFSGGSDFLINFLFYGPRPNRELYIPGRQPTSFFV